MIMMMLNGVDADKLQKWFIFIIYIFKYFLIYDYNNKE